MIRQSNSRAQILAVVNRKGGVAKTTTSINLAHGLSRRLLLRVQKQDISKIQDKAQLFEFNGRHYYMSGHVLLIDFDAQGHCARGLGVNVGKADIGDVLLGRLHLSEAVISADRSTENLPRPNLWLLPASDKLEKAKVTLQNHAFSQSLNGNLQQQDILTTMLEERLHLALENFSYIILDCPPSFDAFSHSVYQFADAAIVPVKPDYFSMDGTGQHIANLRAAQLRGIDIEIHTIVPTFNVARQRLDREMVDSLNNMHGGRVGEPIPRSQSVAEAQSKHQTIFEFDPRHQNPATVAYQKLVDRVYHGKEKT